MAKSGSGCLWLDLKVARLIEALLEEKTAKAQKDATDLNAATLALARDLRLPEVMAYVQGKDPLLRRQKRAVLEKSVDAVLVEFRVEERSILGDELGVEESSEDAEVDDANLVDAKDTNSLNKSLVAMWKTKNTDHSGADPMAKKRSPVPKTQPTNKKPKKNRTPPDINLSSLGGLHAVTTQLLELVGLPILHPEVYLSTGVEPPRGVLLYGPPGCGKTTIANALAGELQVPFISISAPSIVSGMSGESEKKLREVFEEARSLAPCLVFIDEIDAITPKRDGGAQREMERRIVAQLLTSMDELSLNNTDGKAVIVLGATNRPDSLDSALRRAGRFDREILLSLPDERQRCAILKTMTASLKLQNVTHLNYTELAKLTPGFVGADLKSLVTAAGIVAIKRIFESLSVLETAPGSDKMDVDSTIRTQFHGKSDAEKLSTIQRFLAAHPSPLTAEQLEPLSITYDDFRAALSTVQPTAKREGFTTVPDVTWKNVGALTKVRMELHMCVVQPIKKPELYRKVGISTPAGMLMWGPPGCGKTLLAKAVANESCANFISVKGPELLNKYVGESERAVRQLFQRARASAPCIIFFDELDALVPRRNASLSESSARVVNTLLTELDGLNDRQGIFVIGATNRPDMIDAAMLRPGRLDKTLYIELPTAAERHEILRTLVTVNCTPLAPDVDLRDVAESPICRNFSGADLSLLVREASVLALKKKFFHGQHVQQLDASGFYVDSAVDDTIEVTREDFIKALDLIAPSVSDKDRARYDRLHLKMGWGVIEAEKQSAEETA